MKREGAVTVSPWQVALTAVAVAAGFFLVAQVRTEHSIETGLQVSSGRLGEVAYRYRDAEHQDAALRDRLAILRQQIADEEQQAAAGRQATQALDDDLERLRALAGLTPVQGPGVLVTIADSNRPLRPGEDPNLVLIHYSDVHAVVATLLAAGAEAVAVNGERVVATTGISCVGTTILCNARRLAPPYRIEAIGDPAALRAAVSAQGGILDELRSFGFPVSVVAESDVRLPAYAGTFVHRFARPVQNGG